MKKIFAYIILPFFFLYSSAIGQSKLDSIEYNGEYYYKVPRLYYGADVHTGSIKKDLGCPEEEMLPDGQWIQYSKDGAYHPGRIFTLKNDTLDGPYRRYHENGMVVEEGSYKNGGKSGEWVYRYYDGSTESFGKFAMIEGYPQPIGKWIWYYQDGTVKKIGEYSTREDFPYSFETGEWKWFYEDGKPHKIEYYSDEGIKTGRWMSYYDNGRLRLEENYSNGDYDEYVTEYYDNGQLKSKLLYVPIKHKSSRIKDSTYTFYYENGKLKEKGSYKYGLKNGLWKSWYDNGNLKSKGHFTNRKYVFCGSEPFLVFYLIKDGEWEYWYRNGEKMAEGVYEFGKKHIETNCEGGAEIVTFHTTSEWEYWDEDGNPVSKDFLIEKGLWHTYNQPMEEVSRDYHDDIAEIPE